MELTYRLKDQNPQRLDSVDITIWSRDVRDDTKALDVSAGRVRLAVMALATLLLLVDMIFKPGA